MVNWNKKKLTELWNSIKTKLNLDDDKVNEIVKIINKNVDDARIVPLLDKLYSISQIEEIKSLKSKILSQISLSRREFLGKGLSLAKAGSVAAIGSQIAPYINLLSLLSPSPASAEEARRNCVKNIEIDIYFDKIENDLISAYFFKELEPRKGDFVRDLIDPISYIFQSKLNIPVGLSKYHSYKKISLNTIWPKKFKVFYVSFETFIRDYLYDFDSILKMFEDIGHKEMADTMKSEIEFLRLKSGKIEAEKLKKVHYTEIKETLGRSMGLALVKKRTIFLFGSPKLQTYLLRKFFIRTKESLDATIKALAKYIGAILVHEIGHLFGLQHASGRLFDGKLNIMDPDLEAENFDRSVGDVLEYNFGFSNKDGSIIKSNIC